ncbi:MAG: ABC transporter permease subunit [Candidatus Pristimantibacillus lignocellulolyticus]|uniref:ABC transporter permease subunit n=1 Tax=Candidatus Pristimantibacillus lignocellulolyticus TaxID=2994561 RepID=A0A9J6ZK28_9BACL|nr:MAG: ABC transporter permease subunit [Candidatus Pristimantibacillus lignocellulolyticus]
MNKHKLHVLYVSLLTMVLLIVSFGPALSVFAEEATEQPKKTLVMGTSPDFPPYESVDAKNNGEIIGLDIDIAKYILNELGYELKIASMDFGGLIAAMQSGRVDFIMSGMSATEERKQSVDFSDPYYFARNTIVSKKDSNYNSIESLNGKIIGAQLGSVQEAVAYSVEDAAEVRKLNKIADLIQELNSNRIDAAIVEDAVAVEMTNANGQLEMNFLPSDSNDNGYAIAFPKGSPYVAEFNTVIAQMQENGKLDELLLKWFPDANAESAVNKKLIDFSVLEGYVPYIMKGVGVTLLFTLVSAVLGFILGSLLSLCKISGIKPLEWFATAYTSIFRGTPLLVQLMLIYYATPQLTGYDIPALLAAGLAFGLNSAAYLSETIRAGIMAVDKGQREAAIALGIPYRKMMISIIFPQALRNILPALVNECVALIKESSLVSVIGVADLMRRADVVRASTFRSFEALLLIAAIYYVLVLVLTSLARMLERRLRRSD